MRTLPFHLILSTLLLFSWTPTASAQEALLDAAELLHSFSGSGVEPVIELGKDEVLLHLFEHYRGDLHRIVSLERGFSSSSLEEMREQFGFGGREDDSDRPSMAPRSGGDAPDSLGADGYKGGDSPFPDTSDSGSSQEVAHEAAHTTQQKGSSGLKDFDPDFWGGVIEVGTFWNTDGALRVLIMLPPMKEDMWGQPAPHVDEILEGEFDSSKKIPSPCGPEGESLYKQGADLGGYELQWQKSNGYTDPVRE